ncbi:MAG: hypothetical protein RL758_116 [Pseudomonadota bacterium]|jgi:hypothetical protein
MSSVYFDPAVGGNGSTVSDDANPSTGLADGGHRTRFVPALAQVVAIAGNTVTKAQEAAASAASASASALTAINAPGTQATSTSSVSIGTGSKSFTLAQTGKSFVVGQYVQVVSTASPANYMVGAVTAFNSGTGAMTISVTNAANVGGSGTFSAWAVLPSSPLPPNGMALLATVTPTNGASTVVVTGLQASSELIILGTKAVLNGNSNLSFAASANNGTNWTSESSVSGTTTIHSFKAAVSLANITSADKLVEWQGEAATRGFGNLTMPTTGAVNALRITAPSSTFTGVGTIYVYGVN